MGKRVFAAATTAVAGLVLAGGPVAAQTYPPPADAIAVDDATPTRGQTLAVTLQTCKPGTIALIGFDLSLGSTPTVGGDGVARGTVTVPGWARLGRHTVSGACLAPDLHPVVLTTHVTVVADLTGGGTAAAPPSGGGSGRIYRPAGTGSLAALDAGAVPATADALYETAAAANGANEGGRGPGQPTVQRSDASDLGAADSDPGTLSTIARVVLGVAALGGVPVALAISRRPRRVVQRNFA